MTTIELKLHKRIGEAIADAFLDYWLIVDPTGKPMVRMNWLSGLSRFVRLLQTSGLAYDDLASRDGASALQAWMTVVGPQLQNSLSPAEQTYAVNYAFNDHWALIFRYAHQAVREEISDAIGSAKLHDSA